MWTQGWIFRGYWVRRHVLISIRTRVDTTELERGRALVELLDSHGLTPEQVSFNPDKFMDDFLGDESLERWWAAMASVRSQGRSFEAPMPFAWRRKRVVKSSGYVRHRIYNHAGKLVPGSVNSPPRGTPESTGGRSSVSLPGSFLPRLECSICSPLANSGDGAHGRPLKLGRSEPRWLLSCTTSHGQPTLVTSSPKRVIGLRWRGRASLSMSTQMDTSCRSQLAWRIWIEALICSQLGELS